MSNTTMNPKTNSPKRNSEAGFTLIEATVATLILMFGLASIFNLMIVATTSNNVANRASVATALAAQQMEVLRSAPYGTLAPSPLDSLDVCYAPNFCQDTTVEGVGTFQTRWLLQQVGGPNLGFIEVRTEPGGFRGRTARADFTTIRACTVGIPAGCPL
jgi:type II secretory pathway pseudopilin PulG